MSDSGHQRETLLQDEEQQRGLALEQAMAVSRIASHSKDHDRIGVLVHNQCEYHRIMTRKCLMAAIGFAALRLGDDYMPTILSVANTIGLYLTGGITLIHEYGMMQGKRTVEHLRKTHVYRLQMILRHFKEEPLLKEATERLEEEILERYSDDR